MEEKAKTIGKLTIEEREEVLVDAARTLEDTAREAFVTGNKHFAWLSKNMADAIHIHADELARDDPQHAERVLLQASAMISQFNAAHPYRLVSHALH